MVKTEFSLDETSSGRDGFVRTISRVSVDASVDLDGQYRALRECGGLVDRTDRGKLVVSGPDAVDFLQGQLTNDLEALVPGSGCYAALLDRKGHMQADLRVLRLSDQEVWLDTEPGAADVVLRHLSTYKVGRQVEIAQPGSEVAILSLLGPAASQLVATGPLAPEHAHRELQIGGVPCRAVATDLGIDLICPTSGAADVAGALVDAGAVQVSEPAAEILRVESGRPRFGREMTATTIPQEAGIDGRAVSFTKGCYIGQETVARLHYRGKPNRHLRGLRLDAPVTQDDAIALEGRGVGRVGTAVISPAHGPIALAVIRREAAPGALVQVGGTGVGGQVVDLPF
jgi:folate-binding protein YgfZ